MSKIELVRETGMGEYYTLTGLGILVELIMDAVEISGANPADVFLKFQRSGTVFDVTFPTPHTILFENCRIEDGKLKFNLGKASWNYKLREVVKNQKALPLADPAFTKQLADCIIERSTTHRATKRALRKNKA